LADGRQANAPFPVLQRLNMNAQVLGNRALQEVKLQPPVLDVLPDGIWLYHKGL